jgi:hypothetical protein
VRARLVLGAAAAAALLGGPSVPRAADAPALSVDVIASSEAAGQVSWRAWRVELRPPVELRRAVFRLPLDPEVSRPALAALARSAGTAVGHATVTVVDGDSVGVGVEPLATGPCADEPPGTLGGWHVGSGETCLPVRLDEEPGGRLALAVELSGRPHVAALELRLVAVRTGGGPLLNPNPVEPVPVDVAASATTSAGETGDVVREVVGGVTQVRLTASRSRVVYGTTVVFSGQVVRAGLPSPGERVVANDFYLSATNTPLEPRAEGVTDELGRFRLEAPLRASARWAVWASRPGSAESPRLNLLVGVTRRALEVRAPVPAIRLLRVRPARRGLLRADVAVVNPLGTRETLRCRLVVGRRVYDRRFPSLSPRLVFRVRGRHGDRVRASVYRRIAGRPDIAPGRSRTLSL